MCDIEEVVEPLPISIEALAQNIQLTLSATMLDDNTPIGSPFTDTHTWVFAHGKQKPEVLLGGLIDVAQLRKLARAAWQRANELEALTSAS